jgi:hypothetical protein
MIYKLMIYYFNQISLFITDDSSPGPFSHSKQNSLLLLCSFELLNVISIWLYFEFDYNSNFIYLGILICFILIYTINFFLFIHKGKMERIFELCHSMSQTKKNSWILFYNWIRYRITCYFLLFIHITLYNVKSDL